MYSFKCMTGPSNVRCTVDADRVVTVSWEATPYERHVVGSYWVCVDSDPPCSFDKHLDNIAADARSVSFRVSANIRTIAPMVVVQGVPGDGTYNSVGRGTGPRGDVVTIDVRVG
jgi:hypothetical protein